MLSVIFHILTRRHPMTDYPEISTLLSFLGVPNFSNSHWSVNSGWEWASCLAEFEKQDIKERIRESNFIALSLDEAMTIDNMSWACMHVYTIKNHVHQPHLLCVSKIEGKCNSENFVSTS